MSCGPGSLQPPRPPLQPFLTMTLFAENSLMQMDADRIVLAHGGGGQLTSQLLGSVILPALANPVLSELGDSAVLEPAAGPLAFTTDSYVVQPIEFPGGDIGRLAVCGTTNDLAMAGAEPIALSLAMILEEGLEVATLQRIVASIAAAAAEANVRVVTGDTKVIERGRGDGLYITTAGVGRVLPEAALGYGRIETGDAIIINGPIAEHGLTVLSKRKGLGLRQQTQERCGAAGGPWRTCWCVELKDAVRFMRDPTRGRAWRAWSARSRQGPASRWRFTRTRCR